MSAKNVPRPDFSLHSLVRLEDAPKDGSHVRLLVRHRNYEYAADKDKSNWEGFVTAQWITHNGGGWTWSGMNGTPVAWMPYAKPNDLKLSDDSEVAR